jgi:hypothetical protein
VNPVTLAMQYGTFAGMPLQPTHALYK